MYIELTADPGETILSASTEAVRVAELLNMSVYFTFNSVRVIAKPKADPVMLEQLFFREFESDRTHKVICHQPGVTQL